MQQVAVLIPVYQQTLNELEQKSLAQCQKILGKHPIIFVAPEGLNPDYFQEVPEHKVIYFDPSYFKNTSTYNQLLVSTNFYKCFEAFEYLLIYQLDAYVFEDQLLSWCNRGFDYVGSPQLTGKHFQDSTYKNTWRKPLVLNGGFSLRKVSSFIKLLKIYHLLYTKWPANEDTLFSFYHRRAWPLRFFFKLPTWQEALGFGFENDPEKCFEINQQQLPFGCHAWEKYNPRFWDRYIG
jgi:hypothetical protein